MILETEKALECLNSGGILIYPSDTLWAIGCDATNTEAIDKIYKIKNRNPSMPFICLMNDFKMTNRYVKTSKEIKNYLKRSSNPTTVIYNDVKNLKAFPESIAIRIPKDKFFLTIPVSLTLGNTTNTVPSTPSIPYHQISFYGTKPYHHWVQLN